MKHLILPLLLVFGLYTATAQNILTVNINDVCQKQTTANTTVSLYSLNNGAETLVKESQSNPAIFDQLVKDKKYKIKIQVADAKEYDFTIKDMVLMHYHILGLQQLQVLGVLASDANKDGKVTASDIVGLSKVKLKVDTSLQKNFILSNSTVIGNITTLSTNEYIIDEVLSSQSISIQAVQLGSVARAQTAYCNGNCPDITDKTARIIYQDMPIQKGKDVEVPIFVSNDFNYQAFDFKLFLKDALIVSAKNGPGTSNVIENNEVHILHHIILNSNTGMSIITLKIHPQKDGNLSDILFLNQTQHTNLATIKKGSCVVNINNVILSQDNIPDQNCVISWPKDITISSCDALVGIPTVDDICQNVITFSYQDSIVSPCGVKYRKWYAKNWAKSSSEIHLQKIVVSNAFAHTCNHNFSVNIKDGDQTITARKLVVDPIDGHYYSFTQNDIKDSIRIIKNDKPSVVFFEVYDMTSLEFCITRVEKIHATPIILNVNNIVSIPYTGGEYEVNAIKFSAHGNILPAGISDLRISYDGGAFLPAIKFSETLGGQTISLSLKYRINGIEYTHGTVRAYLSPKSNTDNIGPLKFFAYNDFLAADTEYDIKIYASNFNNILSFQIGFRLKDADVMTVSNGVLEVAASHFYIQAEKALRVLWFEQSARSINISSDKTIFTIRIKPNRSGFLSEFIGLDNTVLASEANYEDPNISEKILLDFSFSQRTSTAEEIEVANHQCIIYPNPSNGDNITLMWSPTFQPKMVYIYDAMGRNMYMDEIVSPESGTMQIEWRHSFYPGLYKIVLKNSTSFITKTWVVK